MVVANVDFAQLSNSQKAEFALKVEWVVRDRLVSGSHDVQVELSPGSVRADVAITSPSGSAAELDAARKSIRRDSGALETDVVNRVKTIADLPITGALTASYADPDQAAIATTKTTTTATTGFLNAAPTPFASGTEAGKAASGFVVALAAIVICVMICCLCGICWLRRQVKVADDDSEEGQDEGQVHPKELPRLPRAQDAWEDSVAPRSSTRARSDGFDGVMPQDGAVSAASSSRLSLESLRLGPASVHVASRKNSKKSSMIVPLAVEESPADLPDIRLTGARLKLVNAESGRRLWASADNRSFGACQANSLVKEDQWWRLEREGESFKIVNVHSGRRLWAETHGARWGVGSSQVGWSSELWIVKPSYQGDKFLISLADRRLWACSNSDAWGLTERGEEVRRDQYWLLEL